MSSTWPLASLNEIEACGDVVFKPQQTGVTSHVVP